MIFAYDYLARVQVFSLEINAVGGKDKFGLGS